MAKEVVKKMDAKVLLLLLIVTATGGWYSYVAFGVWAIAILRNMVKKKEVKQEK